MTTQNNFNTLYVLFNNDIPQETMEHYKNFSSHHEGDSGVDLMTPENGTQTIPTEIDTINFKICCSMVDSNMRPMSYYLVPRSSICKTPWQMANSIGIIDAGYRGNIMAKVRNMSNKNATVVKGQSLFQIVAPDLRPIKIVIVDSLSETSRGSGGFGSTNILN
jgi:dUTP pyrophosphatase